jgi:hypothetical protein
MQGGAKNVGKKECRRKKIGKGDVKRQAKGCKKTGEVNDSEKHRKGRKKRQGGEKERQTILSHDVCNISCCNDLTVAGVLAAAVVFTTVEMSVVPADVVSVPAFAGVPNVVKIPSVYVVSTGSCALLLASPDVLFYCPQPFCLCSSFAVHFSGVPAIPALHPCYCWRPRVFQLSLVLLSGLLLMCSYRCCFIPGAPSVLRVSAAFPTAVEVSFVTGID